MLSLFIYFFYQFHLFQQTFFLSHCLSKVSHSPWQRSLHLYYYRGVHTFFILVALSNAASTFLFSTKNLSEFLQRLLDCTFIAGIYSDVLCTTFFVDKLLLLLDDVQKSLSRKTLAKYARGRKQFVPILLVIVSTCILLIGTL